MVPDSEHFELQRRVRELSFLERITRIASSTLDHDEMLRTIIDETVTATSTQVCSLYLWDDTEKDLILTATNGLAEAGVGRVKLGLGEGITGWVAAEREPLVVPDVRDEPRFTWVPGLDQERFVSMLSVPIVSRDRVVGVMNIQTVAQHDFPQEEIDFVSAIAAQLAGIIERSALSQRQARQLDLERQMVSRLRSLDASKSNLMSMLSHDFRGPLSIAKSYLHGLRRNLSAEDQSACEEIETELQTLENMVDNVMLSLEIEAQRHLVLDLEEFDLVEVITAQSRRMQRTTDKHTVEVKASPDTIAFFGDRRRLQAVIVNLVGNGMKYSPEGGLIRVDIDMLDGSVQVSVTDTGIGVSQRDADVLFERYGRGENALDLGIGGHGLGLFICRQIVEAHGGRIFARPAHPGTSFIFVLPVRSVAPRDG